MSLHNKIRNIYPTLTDNDFFTVIMLLDNSDGKGAYIAEWEHPTLAKPTDEQLAAASDDWTPTEPTAADKLAATGMTIDELKSLLGI